MTAAAPFPEDPDDPTHEVTRLLGEIRKGSKAAADRLFKILLPELKRIARNRLSLERQDHTLQTTALVNEVYIKLTGGSALELNNRAHFLRIAAEVMRHILVDHARRKRSTKRGGDLKRVELTDTLSISKDGLENVLLIDAALSKLEMLDPRQVRIIEMLFFLELDNEETAKTLGLSTRTIIREWKSAQAWLKAELNPNSQP